MTSDGADPLSKYLIAPQAVNTTLGFERVEQRHSLREINGEKVDLQPLFAWINRGRVNRGMKPFDQPCPLPGWRPVEGTVIKVMDDVVLVARGISKTPVIVKNFPMHPGPQQGSNVCVVALETGSLELPSKDGLKDFIPIFDHGLVIKRDAVPAPPSAAATNAAPAKVKTRRDRPPPEKKR